MEEFDEVGDASYLPRQITASDFPQQPYMYTDRMLDMPHTQEEIDVTIKRIKKKMERLVNTYYLYPNEMQILVGFVIEHTEPNVINIITNRGTISLKQALIRNKNDLLKSNLLNRLNTYNMTRLIAIDKSLNTLVNGGKNHKKTKKRKQTKKTKKIKKRKSLNKLSINR